MAAELGVSRLACGPAECRQKLLHQTAHGSGLQQRFAQRACQMGEAHRLHGLRHHRALLPWSARIGVSKKPSNTCTELPQSQDSPLLAQVIACLVSLVKPRCRHQGLKKNYRYFNAVGGLKPTLYKHAIWPLHASFSTTLKRYMRLTALAVKGVSHPKDDSMDQTIKITRSALPGHIHEQS